MIIPILMALIALFATVLACAWLSTHKPHRLFHLGNIAEGVHENAITKRTDAAIATRFLLVKAGSDQNHVAVAGAADLPYGVALDEASAAEEPIAVGFLGASEESRKMVASGAIPAGAFVVPDAGGKVKALPAVPGTYNVVGRALVDVAADGDPIEVDPIPCVQRIV